MRKSLNCVHALLVRSRCTGRAAHMKYMAILLLYIFVVRCIARFVAMGSSCAHALEMSCVYCGGELHRERMLKNDATPKLDWNEIASAAICLDDE
jgi:hypothetical protein